MPEFLEEDGKEGGGTPTWIWIAGGAALLLILMTRGSSNKSTVATDNLLAAEIDANLKAMQASMDEQMKLYQEEQALEWEEFKKSLEELIEEKQGDVAPPAEPIVPQPPKVPQPAFPGLGEYPGGGSFESNRSWIPPVIDGMVHDNFIAGFDYRKAKKGG